PRIYRMGVVPVVLAVIILAFSLEDQPGALTSNVVPDAFNGSHAYATMNMLAKSYPDRQPGSRADNRLAGYVYGQLHGYHYKVSTDYFQGPTPRGERQLENVVGYRAGGGNGSIVIVASRDGVGSPTAGSKPRAAPQPLVVPWSDGQNVAPAALRNTISAALSAQTGLSSAGAGLFGQLAHLAFPMSASEQAPLVADGFPAVELSLSSGRDPAPNERISASRIGDMGRAVLAAGSALEAGPAVGSPSTYMLWDGKV